MAKQIKLKRFEPISYYEDILKTLDMQVGECYAAFLRDNNLNAIWLIVGKEEREGFCGKLNVWKVKRVVIINRGFYREDNYITADKIRMGQYINIMQVDRKRFDKLDKSVALINAQLNAYQCEFKDLIEK